MHLAFKTWSPRLVSAEHPRRSRGVAAIRQRIIRSAERPVETPVDPAVGGHAGAGPENLAYEQCLDDDGAPKRLRVSEELDDRAERANLPRTFFCAISQSVMKDPVLAADGHTYERDAITQWFARKDTSPMTNEPLAHKHLTPNIAIRSAIFELLARSGT